MSTMSSAEASRAEELLRAAIGGQVNAGNPTRQLNLDIATRRGNNANGSIATDYYEQLQNTNPTSVVAATMRESDPRFADIPVKYLEEQIDYIVERGQGRINPAQAAAIIGRRLTTSLNPTDDRIINLARDFFGMGPGSWGDRRDDETRLGADGRRVLDQDRIAEDIEGILNGDVQREVEEQARLGDVMTRLQQAENTFRLAQQRHQSLTNRLRAGDYRVENMVARSAQAVEEHRMMLEMVRREAGAFQNNVTSGKASKQTR